MRETNFHNFLVGENFFASPHQSAYADSRCDCVGIDATASASATAWASPPGGILVPLLQSSEFVCSVFAARQNCGPAYGRKERTDSRISKTHFPPAILSIRFPLVFAKQNDRPDIGRSKGESLFPLLQSSEFVCSVFAARQNCVPAYGRKERTYKHQFTDVYNRQQSRPVRY